MSKLMNKLSLGLVLSVGVVMVAYYQSDTTMEDVGEQIALKLLEILPRKHKMQQEMQFKEPEVPVATPPRSAPPINSNETKEKPPLHKKEEEVETEVEEEIELSKASIFDPVGHYNAKEAMQNRYDALKEMCMNYGDFMRPERVITEIAPEKEELLLHPPAKMLFCPMDGVAAKSMDTFYNRIKEPGQEYLNKLKAFDRNYPRSASDKLRALVVRHPLERIVASYRHNFEKSLNAMTGEESGGEISFADFIDVVLNGYLEFAEFLEENELSGHKAGSAAIDTGLIDGESGTSRAWNPYWRTCAVCNPDFLPHFIMHLDHFKEDAKVLVEMMGHPRYSEDFLRAEVTPTSGLREVEEHYWGQVSKGDIKALYQKYKLDHELFGFTPEYYIALGKDD